VEQVTGFWQGRRGLVTGATGMGGSWLVKDLLQGGAVGERPESPKENARTPLDSTARGPTPGE